jgi:hypothetical protein
MFPYNNVTGFTEASSEYVTTVNLLKSLMKLACTQFLAHTEEAFG